MAISSLQHQWILGRRNHLGGPLIQFAMLAILLYFLVIDAYMWHWFLIPVLCCGLLIGPDAIRWLQGQYDLFDPKGLMGIYGLYFFFIAPLLLVHWRLEIPRFDNAIDWRHWVGLMAVLNVAALALYLRFHALGYSLRRSVLGRPWKIHGDIGGKILFFFFLVSFAAQLYYFQLMGGISGIIAWHTYNLERPVGAGTFRTLGAAFLVILLIYLSWKRVKAGGKSASLFVALTIVIVFTGIQFILSGLHGSRGAVLFMAFWIAGIVHYFWRPFKVRQLLLGLPFLLGFMYVYNFYDVLGSEAINMLLQGKPLRELEQATGRDNRVLYIEDLSRTSTHSYQIYRLSMSDEYELRWGRTYVDSFAHYIPTWIWSDKPIDPEKRIAGTDLLFGPGVYEPGNRERKNSLRVYGLLGEALLNFGVLLAPLPFAIWGFLMGIYRRSLLTWSPTDARLFLAPYLTLAFIFCVFFDLDDFVAVLLFRASPVIVVLYLASLRSWRNITK
jgi:hypothetical protein